MHATLADVIADTAQNSIEAGAKRVEVSLVELDGRIAVDIRDNGKGMDEATLKRAVELNKDSADARAESYFHLAEVSVAKKDMKSARAYATVVVMLFENSGWSAKAEAILKSLPEEEAS